MAKCFEFQTNFNRNEILFDGKTRAITLIKTIISTWWYSNVQFIVKNEWFCSFYSPFELLFNLGPLQKVCMDLSLLMLAFFPFWLLRLVFWSVSFFSLLLISNNHTAIDDFTLHQYSFIHWQTALIQLTNYFDWYESIWVLKKQQQRKSKQKFIIHHRIFEYLFDTHT